MLWSAIVALAITVAIEVPVVALLYPGQRTRMAVACAVGTTGTNLFMNLALAQASGAPARALLIGELLALVVEAALYFAVARPRELGRALVASAVANALSLGAGWLIHGI